MQNITEADKDLKKVEQAGGIRNKLIIFTTCTSVPMCLFMHA